MHHPYIHNPNFSLFYSTTYTVLPQRTNISCIASHWMGRTGFLLLGLFLVFFSSTLSPTHQATTTTGNVTKVDVGVVLNMGDFVGRTSKVCLEMGFEDFYAAHPDYTTRAVLHFRDSGNDSVGAASGALDLIKNVQVQAILGPERLSQASFVIDLGSKAQVPIVSFTVTSPSLSPSRNPYFIRTAMNSLFQVDGLASIVKLFGWRSVVLIYEKTEYGSGLLPYLVDALQDVDAKVPTRCVISTSASDERIASELYKLMTMQTRVFIVHMLPPLSSRVFFHVKKLGMMSDGYAWIITEALTDLLSNLNPQSIDSMQGVIGIKTSLQKSEDVDNFTARWKARYHQENPDASDESPSINGIRAYDTARALSTAIEKVGGKKLGFKTLNISDDSTDLSNLKVSKNGPQLWEAILSTKFRGIGGSFQLVDGQLQSSTFQILNLVQSEWREVGSWTKKNGISEPLSLNGGKYLASNMNTISIVWPGGLHDVPKGWEIPTKGNIFKVGVPVKGGFIEFVNTKAPKVSGYCIDVFDAVMKELEYNVHYKYIPYHFAQHPGSYNDLVDQVVFEKFDAIVGDVTIVANRSLYIDFTLPYTESGVSMVVPIRKDQEMNGWIFLKPLPMKLWLVSLAFFFFTGFVVWAIEHRINDEFRGNWYQQMGTIFYFAFSTLVFSHKEKVESNFSKFVVIIWVFVVLILTSSYTASLASMLTVEWLKPTFTDIMELVKNGEYVGYQDGSFVRELLKKLKFDESKLRNYTSPDAYAEALSKGSRNGGVAAIFDEVPYLKLFLKDRCSQYAMVGQTYKTDGFGFVFPKGSPMVPDVSRAILKVTQGDKMLQIEDKKWFGNQTSCPTVSSILTSSRLQFTSFWGLFLITGVVSLISLFIFFCKYRHDNAGQLKGSMASENSMWGKLSVSMEHFAEKDSTLRKPKNDNEIMSVRSVSTMTSMLASPMPSHADNSANPFSTSDESFSDRLPVEKHPSIE